MSAYLDRMETFILVIIAVLFTLTVDLPTQNVVKLLMNSNLFASAVKASDDHEVRESSADDFVSPFDDREEEEVFAFRPVKFNYNSYTSDDHDENVNGE